MKCEKLKLKNNYNKVILKYLYEQIKNLHLKNSTKIYNFANF
jgi:hypothetical protein